MSRGPTPRGPGRTSEALGSADPRNRRLHESEAAPDQQYGRGLTTDRQGRLTLDLGNGLAFEASGKLSATAGGSGDAPAVSGSRADGTALASLLAALDQAGIIQDNTTA